jgi:hypothetical protein
MKTILLISLILFISRSYAQESEFSIKATDFQPSLLKDIVAPELNTLSEAAEWADLVAVVQVDDIEYNKIRQLNSEGFAYLNVLIPYKGAEFEEPIAVIAYGFEENACYFPDRVNEGERYLTFLKKAPGEKTNVYYGFKPFCQMQVLISDLGQYHIRYPLDNDSLTIPESIIKDINYYEPHAILDATLWTGTKREEYAAKYKCEIIEGEEKFNRTYKLKYTQGIHISDIRKLLDIKYKPKITSKQI